MKPVRLTLIAATFALLGGCVAYPVDPGYYGQPYYGSAPAYYGSPHYTAPAYYGSPYYYGAPYYWPSVGIGIYGGSRAYYHRHGPWRGHYGYRY